MNIKKKMMLFFLMVVISREALGMNKNIPPQSGGKTKPSSKKTSTQPLTRPRITSTAHPNPQLTVALGTKPKGIINLGNHCYMNSTLQALSRLSVGEKIIKLLQHHQQDATTKNVLSVMQSLHNKSVDNTTPYKVQTIMRNLFSNVGQQDASEALGYLLEKFVAQSNEEDRKSWTKLFAFEYRISLQHDTCFHGYTIDPAFILFLEIEDLHQNKLVSELIPTALANESIDGYFCDKPNKPNEYVKLNRSKKLAQLPQILIIAPKRFKFDLEKLQAVKINTPINPEQNLIIPAELTQENQAASYKLAALICHSGGVGGGHYWAYAQQNNIWYKFNDSTVTEEKPFFSSPYPYIFFYEREKKQSSQKEISIPKIQANTSPSLFTSTSQFSPLSLPIKEKNAAQACTNALLHILSNIPETTEKLITLLAGASNPFPTHLRHAIQSLLSHDQFFSAYYAEEFYRSFASYDLPSQPTSISIFNRFYEIIKDTLSPALQNQFDEILSNQIDKLSLINFADIVVRKSTNPLNTNDYDLIGFIDAPNNSKICKTIIKSHGTWYQIDEYQNKTEFYAEPEQPSGLAFYKKRPLAVLPPSPPSKKFLEFVNLKDTVTGNSPLHLAAQSGNFNLILALLESGADKEIKNYFEQTAANVARNDKKHEISTTIADAIDQYVPHIVTPESPEFLSLTQQ